jgi:hypothetical protein
MTTTLTKPRKSHAYTPKPNMNRILEIYRQATVAELEEGLSWYKDAHAVAVALDPENPRRAAGVLAALSPRMPWERNIMLAARAYEEFHNYPQDSAWASGALLANCVKADRILRGEDPLDVLGGDKVRAFFETIADPMSDAVVVDRHAFDVAMGRVTNDESRAALGRVGMYERFAKRYVMAARHLSQETGANISASQVQAVTWTVWRRLKGLA